MSVLSKATGHFKEKLSGEMKSIDVPEWDTTIYYKSVSTFVQQQKVIELHAKGKMVDALVETLIGRCLDKDGKKVFTAADRDVLMREVDPNVIIRVCTAINEEQASEDADVKN
jgi:hypothetical protein